VTRKKKTFSIHQKQVRLLPEERDLNMINTHWGQLANIEGVILRDATKREWQDSYANNLRMGMGGWIETTVHAVTDQGEEKEVKILGCVIGGPNERYPEQPTVKG
jgi:hypothetical protein